MTNEKKVVAFSNLPYRLPTFQSILAWLALDHWHAPIWLYGAVATVFLFAWIGSIANMINQKQVDIFKEPKP